MQPVQTAPDRRGPQTVPALQAVDSIDPDRVSICLITYNEEEFLEPCLQRLRPWFGEFCVLDMGSHDRTATIARDVLGADVALAEWPRRNLFARGFAAARNAATDLARRPWAFHVDADELRTLESPTGRIPLKAGPSARPAWKVGRRNLAGQAPASWDAGTLAPYEASSVEQHVRLFRREPGVAWIGFLHEEVFIGNERATFSAPEAEISLDHISQFKSGESRGLKESFYAWMLMTAYFTPEIRSQMQPEYIQHTERFWEHLYPIALDFGAREGLSCEWAPLPVR